MKRLLPLFIYLIVFLIFKDYSLVGIILFLMICWLLKYRDWTCIGLVILLLCLHQYSTLPQSYTLEGKITQLTRNAIIIEKDGIFTLINNCNLRRLDAIIRVEGEPQRIANAPTTYGAKFQTWATQQKITHSIYAKKCTLIHQASTLRYQVQQQINRFDEKYRDLLYKILFFVPIQQASGWVIYNQLGLSVVGILALFRLLGKMILNEKQVAAVELAILLVFSLFYQFSFICVRYLLAFFLRYLSVDQQVKTGLLGCLCIGLFPQKALTLSCLIPLGIRICHLTYPRAKRLAPTFWLVFLQSIFFSKIQLGYLIGYRLLLPLFGLLSCCAWLALFFQQPHFLLVAQTLLAVVSALSKISLLGNPIGFGFLLYVLLCFQFPKFKLVSCFVLYLVFCHTGLFHPLTEVVFVQIGQGDAIVIKEALNQSVTLIDVGDLKNYSLLKQALFARSIRDIDQIIITHSDRDHAGNLDEIQKDFNVKRVITEPCDLDLESMTFKALKRQATLDENDNSLVYVLFVKNIQILFTGDISSKVERELLRSYDLSNIDILKLAHHGSKTSTSAQLLIETRSQLAINSSGLNNRYHHPHGQVVQRVKDFGNYFLDTQKEGDISVFFLRNWNFFITSTKKIGIIDKE